MNALNAIVNFVTGDASAGLAFPSGVKAPFNPDPFNDNSGSTFTMEAWSGGQTIGQGSVSVAAVPEPLSIFALAPGVIAFLRRRRK